MADRDHERGTAGESAAASGRAHGDAAPRRDRVRDPVCGMMITPSDATLRSDHEDVRYYFCSTGCKARFDAAPESYRAAAGIEGDDAGFAKPHGDPVHPGRDQPAASCHPHGPADAEKASSAQGAIWTCPMHPEIRRNGPGSCPICGMALEPLVAAPDTGPNPELIDMTRRFWGGFALGLPVFLLEMGGHIFPGLHHLVPMGVSVWIQLLLATPVVLWAGWPFFERAWVSLVNRSPNMFTLIAMGAGVPGPTASSPRWRRGFFRRPSRPPTA